MDIYSVFALAKRLNISFDETKEMTYISLINLLISNVENSVTEKSEYRTATQEDIDRMFG